MKKVLIVSLLLMFFSCDDIIFDEDTGKIDTLKSGFSAYEATRYDNAKKFFNAAIEDGTIVRRDTAYMGLGYTELKLQDFVLSEEAYDNALELNENMTEALYGKMVISYAFHKNYDSAIGYGLRIVELDSNYTFEHEETSNISDVYLHLAHSEYQKKNYEQSYLYTRKISSRVIDINSNRFTMDLASHLSDLSNELKGN